jgi:hypothetical protein
LIPRSLLLIDADPAVQDHLSGLLKRDDREIQHAPGSKEALLLLRNGPIDLVLGHSAWAGTITGDYNERSRIFGWMMGLGLAGTYMPGMRMVAERFQHCDVGDQLKLAGREWTIVGVFDSNGRTYDSEIWGDVELFMPVFDRPVYQSLTLRLAEPGYLAPLKKRLESDPRMSVEVEREDRFYAKQSGQLSTMLRVLGLFVTSIMSLGAVFGALNTMYAAVGNRTREIGTLLAIGFSRGAILTSFLIESVLLALVGGALGCLLALPVRSFTTGTMSFATFSELAFRFQVTPGMLVLGLAFSAFMGLLGGFLPARKAATMPIVDSLRQA